MCSCSHLTGKPDWLRLARADFVKLSPASRIKGNRDEQISRKTVSRKRGRTNYCDLAKNHALGRHVCEISEKGGQKWGPTAIYPIPQYTQSRSQKENSIIVGESARRSLTLLRMSGGLCHVTTQFYYCMIDGC